MGIRIPKVAASFENITRRSRVEDRITCSTTNRRPGAVPPRTVVPGQYWSLETISPPALLPKLHTIFIAVLDLRNRTDPSAIATLPPPGWKLLNPYMPGQSKSPFQEQVRQLGMLGLGASSVLPKL
jgi:hypothetical protein